MDTTEVIEATEEVEKDKKEGFFKKVLKFLKKFWYLLLVPVTLIFKSLLTSPSKKELKQKRKEVEKDKKDLDIQKEKALSVEETLKDDIAKAEEVIKTSKEVIKDKEEKEEIRKENLQEFLPGLKK